MSWLMESQGGVQGYAIATKLLNLSKGERWRDVLHLQLG
ncbi:unnamed protein product [Arabidopsis halleri]